MKEGQSGAVKVGTAVVKVKVTRRREEDKDDYMEEGVILSSVSPAEQFSEGAPGSLL